MAGANGIWWKVWYQISLMCLGSRQRAPTPCVPQLKKNSPATSVGMVERQPLHGEGADIVADEARAVDAERVHQRGDVVGEDVRARPDRTVPEYGLPLSPKPRKSGAISR